MDLSVPFIFSWEQVPNHLPIYPCKGIANWSRNTDSKFIFGFRKLFAKPCAGTNSLNGSLGLLKLQLVAWSQVRKPFFVFFNIKIYEELLSELMQI